jgi:hypothetical protein
MKRSFDRVGTVTRADRHVVLALLGALSAVACGGTPSDTSGSAAAGTSGSAAAGASGASQGGAGGSSGSAASGGTAIAGGAGGIAGSASAAGSSGAAGSAGGQTCGDQTCGANQYCRAPCSGTGFGGSEARGTCAVLPPACDGVPSCECICGPTKGFCTPGAVEVQCGCP